MSKRFTDTDKWKDAWFMDLEPIMKCFWIYLCDTCDCAGVWRVNFKQASFAIGAVLDKQSAVKALGERVVVLNKEKWFVEKFIRFQYPRGLSQNSKAHSGVLKSLEYHKIETKPYLALIKGNGNSNDTVQEYICINNSSPSFSSSLDPKSALKIDDVIQAFNEILAEKNGSQIGHCHGLSGDQIKEFLKTISYEKFNSINTWREMFSKIAESDFLKGNVVNSSFVLTLNWLVCHDNALKVLNGQYGKGQDKNAAKANSGAHKIPTLTDHEINLLKQAGQI